MKKFTDVVAMVLLCLAILVLAGGTFYFCEIVPMDECMNEGHSFQYCHKLLNK